MLALLIALMFSALNPGPTPEPLLVSIDQAARMLGVSHRMTIKLLDSKELRGLKVGRRRMVPVLAIHEYIAERLDDVS
jgi:excisionase family DNA binding protein